MPETCFKPVQEPALQAMDGEGGRGRGPGRGREYLARVGRDRSDSLGPLAAAQQQQADHVPHDGSFWNILEASTVGAGLLVAGGGVPSRGQESDGEAALGPREAE